MTDHLHMIVKGHTHIMYTWMSIKVTYCEKSVDKIENTHLCEFDKLDYNIIDRYVVGRGGGVITQ